MVAAVRPIPGAVRATQARASDPAASAFVSANAGSGKTHVLVQRVIRLLLEASRDPDSATGRALQIAMASAADVTFKDVVREACLSRDHFMAWTDSAGGTEAAAAQICAALGVDPRDRIEDVERAIVDGPNLPRSRWKEIAETLGRGNKSDSDQAGRVSETLGLTGTGQVDEYLCVFLTDEQTP